MRNNFVLSEYRIEPVPFQGKKLFGEGVLALFPIWHCVWGWSVVTMEMERCRNAVVLP